MLRKLSIPILFCGVFGLICLTYRGMAFQSISPLLCIALALCVFKLIRVTRCYENRVLEIQMLADNLASANGETIALKIKNHEIAERNQQNAKLYQSLQQLLDEVSHDFRTPLSVIKGYSEIMHEGMAGPMSAEQAGFNQMIIDRTRDLAQMVDDMQDTSKIRAGALHAERAPCDVAAIFGGLQPVVRNRALAAGIRWREEIAPELPLVFVDLDKAIRVLSNLALYAMKRSAEGNAILLSATAGLNWEVIVSVQDAGPRIAGEKLESIRRRFESADAPTDCKGPGLALDAANELVRLNGGQMSVASDAQQGTTISFTLPVQKPLDSLALHKKKTVERRELAALCGSRQA